MPRTCWAASLGGCNEMSGEHVFSKRAFASEFIATEGMRKIAPGKRIPLLALTANVLCKTHNEKLSELDSEAGMLSDALRDHFQSQVPREARVKVDGWKVERLLLKCLHGMLASKWVKDLDFLPDPSLVKIAFGQGRLPSYAGLYVVNKPEPVRPSQRDRMGCAVIHDLKDEARAMGAYIQLQGFGFVIKPTPGDPTLSLRASPHSIAGLDWSHAELTHRPAWTALGAYHRKGWEAHERARLTIEFAW